MKFFKIFLKEISQLSVFYKYPILKEDFLNITKKLNDKENVVEFVKTKRVELIVFNRTIGTQIKGPYPKEE